MTVLQGIDDLKRAYGGDTAARKLALLDALERRRLPSARAVERLHESLCVLRAYPDSQAVLDAAERMLAASEQDYAQLNAVLFGILDRLAD